MCIIILKGCKLASDIAIFKIGGEELRIFGDQIKVRPVILRRNLQNGKFFAFGRSFKRFRTCEFRMSAPGVSVPPNPSGNGEKKGPGAPEKVRIRIGWVPDFYAFTRLGEKGENSIVLTKMSLTRSGFLAIWVSIIIRNFPTRSSRSQ